MDKLSEELGMTPAEIRQAIKDGVDLKARAGALETELNTTKASLTSVQNGYDEVKSKMNELEANYRRPATPQTPKTYTSVVDDEDRAFNERFNDAAQPVAMAAVKAGSNAAKMEARLSLQDKFSKTPGGRISHARLWDKWRGEIEKAANEVQPQTNLMMAQTWLNIFDYIKGKHIEEMMEKPTDFIESVSQAAEVKIGNEPPPDRLADSESDVVKKMMKESKFMTPERYLEAKKKMRFVGEA